MVNLDKGVANVYSRSVFFFSVVVCRAIGHGDARAREISIFWRGVSAIDAEVDVAAEDGGATVRFEFRDFDNPWWKSGMEWDFIQISSITS